MVINHHLSLMALLATISFFAIQSPTLVSAGGSPSRLNAGGSSPRLNRYQKEMLDADMELSDYLEKYKSLENLFKDKTPTRDLIEEAIKMLEKEDHPIKYSGHLVEYPKLETAYDRRCKFPKPDSCHWKRRLQTMDLGAASYLDEMKFREEQPFSIVKKSTKKMQQAMTHKINAIGRILTWIGELVKSEEKDSESKTLEKEDLESEILEEKDSGAVISETV